MFEEEPSRRATVVVSVALIALFFGLLVALYLLTNHFGAWAH